MKNNQIGGSGGWKRTLAPLLWFAALATGIAQLLAIVKRPASDRLADLHVYFGSVESLRADGTLYSFVASNGDPFTYPPFAGLILLPLTLSSEAIAGALWTAATLLTLLVAAFALARRMPIAKKESTASAWYPLVALILIASAPVSSNLRLGQVSWFIVALVALDALSFIPEKYRGIATGLAAAVKLTPLIFIPYYWLSGQRRMAVVTTATFMFCTGLAWLTLPDDSMLFWLRKVWETSRIGDLAMGGNQSLNGMLLRWEITGSLKAVLMATVSLAVLCLGLWRATKATRQGRPLTGVAIAGCVSVVISPVSWTHHQVWLLLAGLALLGQWKYWGSSNYWAISILTVMILPVGTALRLVVPFSSFAAENLRGFVAIAIAVALPLGATESDGRGSLDEQRGPRYAQGRRDSLRKTILSVSCAAVLVASSGCSDPTPKIERPAGQSLISVISSGTIDKVRWQVELVEIDGKLCTQSVVVPKIMGSDCDMKLASDPVNIAIEGNDKVLFVRGVIGPSVTKLLSITRQNPNGEQLTVVDGKGQDLSIRYFGFAAAPNDVQDLLAYEASGKQVYSGGGKILSARS